MVIPSPSDEIETESRTPWLIDYFADQAPFYLRLDEDVSLARLLELTAGALELFGADATKLFMFHNNRAGWRNKANNVRGYRIEHVDEISELIKEHSHFRRSVSDQEDYYILDAHGHWLITFSHDTDWIVLHKCKETLDCLARQIPELEKQQRVSRYDGFVNLNVSKDSNLADLRKLSRIWQTHDNATMDVEPMSLEDVRRLTSDILPNLPDSFMAAILCEFATIPDLPDDLLHLIFAHGDTECKIAVALREKLPQELHAACQDASDDDVREHYFQKHGTPDK